MVVILGAWRTLESSLGANHSDGLFQTNRGVTFRNVRLFTIMRDMRFSAKTETMRILYGSNAITTSLVSE